MINHNSAAQNLILGLVRGYTIDKIEPFIISLKKSGYTGDVCFLVSQIDERTKKELLNYGIQLFPFQELGFTLQDKKKGIYAYHLLDAIYKVKPINQIYELNQLFAQTVNSLSSVYGKDRYLAKANIIKNFLNVFCIRYPLYYIYLSKYGQQYSNVMLTDVRDVFFQRDPFDFEIGGNTCCFLEGKTIGACASTSMWIREGYGEQAYAELGNKEVSCSGVTIGTRSSILTYLQSMLDQFIQLKAHRVGGIDQGIHNYVVYKNLAGKIELFENYRGPVLTIGNMGVDEKILLNDDGLLANHDGTVINVVHQYDRLPYRNQSLGDKITALLTR